MGPTVVVVVGLFVVVVVVVVGLAVDWEVNMTGVGLGVGEVTGVTPLDRSCSTWSAVIQVSWSLGQKSPMQMSAQPLNVSWLPQPCLGTLSRQS